MCDPPILRVKLSPCAHCFFQSSAAIQSGVIVCSRFQPLTAETVSFWIIKHKPNRKATFRITHSPFNHHFRVTGWPAGFIGVLYSLFLRFNCVNLWLFLIFFIFYFSEWYFMVPCVIFVLYEVELYAYWLWRKISSGASRCDREFYVEDGPMGDRRYTEVIHAFKSDTY